MQNDRPWREITPDDYLRESSLLTRRAQDALLKAQDAGDFRLRLVLRERDHMKRALKARRDPLYVHDYVYGPTYMVWRAFEVVIERRDGQRYRVDRTTTPWSTIPFGAAVESAG